MIPRFLAPPLTASALAVLLLLSACTSSEGLFGGDRIDYRTEAVKTKPLEVPPDLTQIARDSRYQAIGAAGGTVSAAAAAAAPSASAPAAAAPAAVVAPGKLENLRVERAGQQRWLVVAQQTPEVLWPKVKTFWERSGFTLVLENPQAGVMETNWSENRAKLPDDVVRNLIGRLVRNLYDTGERDLFRTRLERNGDGSVEIYVSHRGIEEVVGGPFNDVPTWRARASDPDLEAEMLARMMLALASAPPAAGGEAPARPAAQALTAAVGTVTAAPQPPARARTTSSGERVSMEVDEPFDRAWRRVGLVLDRGGFTVEDRDRASGIYYVRYSDPKAAGQEEPNFFARIFGGAKDPQTPVRYRIVLKGAGTKTNVDVLTSEGGTGSGENGQRIVARLVDDLK
ncbi:MAG: outer membrane protein assembly factor BamC [Burkholderiales bacterium]|nr:outer membrane protein assembly factor BamC [Burkholderiales bacterium]